MPCIATNNPLRFAGCLATHDPTVNQATTPVTPVTSAEQPAGRSLRRRERIVVRLNGELIEVPNVRALFRLLHSVKTEVRAVAKAKAVEIVRDGKRIGEARREEQPPQVVEAPDTSRLAIEERLDEMDRFYWMTVAKAVRELEQDDEDFFLLNG